MKKRLFSLAAALALCVGLAAPASAAQTPSVIWFDEGLSPAGRLAFCDGLLTVMDSDWKCGFVDTNGKVVISPQYREAGDFSDGLAPVANEDDKWGYIDKTGKLVVPYQYSMAREFSEGMAIVWGYTEDENGDYTWGYGYIDTTGKLVVPMKYEHASDFSEGLAAVENGDLRWGYIDKTGKEVIPPMYYHAGFFQSGMAAVHSAENNKWGYIDKTGQYVVEPTLSCFETEAFYDGNLAIIRNGNVGVFKCGFVNKEGEIVIPRTYDDAKPFYEGLAMVGKGDIYMSQGGLRGYIDESGNVVIPLEYSEASNFSEGLAAVKKDGKAGYINKTGQVVIPFEYDNAYEVVNGKALVEKDGRWGVLSISADPTIPTVGGFTDVKVGDYFADAVLWAVDKSVTNGTGDNTFSPSSTCTHAQILTFLYRADRGEGSATADDMTKAVSWAREKGMIDDTFDGNKPCTRADAVSYIWQAFGRKTAGSNSFTDVPASADYAAAVAWAVGNGITDGTGNNQFSPNDTCTRGQIVTFLHRAYVPAARLTV